MVLSTHIYIDLKSTHNPCFLITQIHIDLKEPLKTHDISTEISLDLTKNSFFSAQEHP